MIYGLEYQQSNFLKTNLQVHLVNSKYSRFPRIQILNFRFVGSKSLWFILWAILNPNSMDYLLKPKQFSPTLSIAVHLQFLFPECAPSSSSNHYPLPNNYTKLGPLIKTKVSWTNCPRNKDLLSIATLIYFDHVLNFSWNTSWWWRATTLKPNYLSLCINFVVCWLWLLAGYFILCHRFLVWLLCFAL